MPLWLGLSLLSALAWGVGQIFLKAALTRSHPSVAYFVVSVVSICIVAGLAVLTGTAQLAFLPLALALGKFQVLTWPPSPGEQALLAHSVLAAINFYAIFELIRIAGPTYMTQANFLSVGFGVVFGLVLFGESHSLFVWAAIALILSASAATAPTWRTWATTTRSPNPTRSTSTRPRSSPGSRRARRSARPRSAAHRGGCARGPPAR